MIHVDIPGFRELTLDHLVLDFNGTLAVDGTLVPGVGERLVRLRDLIRIHVLTADTFGTASSQLAPFQVNLIVIPETSQADAKADYIGRLDAQKVIAIGNGRNDRKMLSTAALGIVVIQQEGAGVESVSHADIAVTSVLNALDLIANPKRLIATLRD